MFERILVVCTGNICRSPVAEALLKVRLPHLHIGSAGLNALVGRACEPAARTLAEASENLNLTEHRARQITPELIQQAELILVMSEGQRQAIAELVPVSTGKTMLFGHWLDDGNKEIADPYRKSSEAFTYVHQRLTAAADTWQQKLQ